MQLLISGQKTTAPIDKMSKSDNSSISSADITEIIEQLKMERHRHSTRINYYGIWKGFNKFFVRLDSKPDNWEDRILLYAGYLVTSGKKSSTIRCYISAIKAILFNIGREVQEDRLLLSSIIRACKINYDTARVKLPIRKGLLNTLVKSVDKLFDSPQPYLEAMYKALLTTAYYRLFRIGELTLGPHVVKVKDVHVGVNKKKLMFVLHSSKTHNPSDKPQIIKIDAIPNQSLHDGDENKRNPVCPFQLLHEYSLLRKPYKNSTYLRA